MNNDDGKIAILLSTYNGSSWIKEQIESIFNQDYKNYEIYIFDDNSSDDTISIIEKINSDKIRVKRFFSNSGSAGDNFKRALLEMESESFSYLALADQDDIWMKDKLSTAIKKLKNSNFDGYSCSVEAFWPDNRKKIIKQSKKVSKYDYFFEGAGQGCTFLITRQLFDRVATSMRSHPDLIKKVHYHDWLIYFICRTYDMEWLFDESVHMLYRQHGGNEIGSRGKFKGIIKRINLIRDGWYQSQISNYFDLYHALLLNDPKLENNNIINKVPTNPVIQVLKLNMQFRRRALDSLIVSFSIIVGWVELKLK